MLFHQRIGLPILSSGFGVVSELVYELVSEISAVMACGFESHLPQFNEDQTTSTWCWVSTGPWIQAKSLINLDMRWSWRVTPDCKSGPSRVSRFDSYHVHQFGGIDHYGDGTGCSPVALWPARFDSLYLHHFGERMGSRRVPSGIVHLIL